MNYHYSISIYFSDISLNPKISRLLTHNHKSTIKKIKKERHQTEKRERRREILSSRSMPNRYELIV